MTSKMQTIMLMNENKIEKSENSNFRCEHDW